MPPFGCFTWLTRSGSFGASERFVAIDFKAAIKERYVGDRITDRMLVAPEPDIS